jgi:hypothetical protein
MSAGLVLTRRWYGMGVDPAMALARVLEVSARDIRVRERCPDHEIGGQEECARYAVFRDGWTVVKTRTSGRAEWDRRPEERSTAADAKSTPGVFLLYQKGKGLPHLFRLKTVRSTISCTREDPKLVGAF